MALLLISLAPILLIALYIYRRDKYEKEPRKQLLKALLVGVIIVVPIFFVESLLQDLFTIKDSYSRAMYTAFVVAACTEELFKYLAFFAVIWRNKNFNEFFDGIVYATYISLGFAAVENVFYVYQNGFNVAILRAFTAVPCHALFGIAMGYYFSLAKFNNKYTGIYLVLAIVTPIVLHGIYDFCLMSGESWLLIILLFFLIYLWISGFRKMKKHSKKSIFAGRDNLLDRDL